MSTDPTYWAALPTDEIAAAIKQKVDDYQRVCELTGRLDLWRKVYRAIYGMDKEGRHLASQTARDGDQGELVSIKIGHTRNLSNHIVNLTCQQKLGYDCRAANTDYESMKQTILGQMVLDWYVREKRLGQTLRRGVKFATDFGESFAVLEWDEAAGKVYDRDPGTGSFIHEGDVSARVFMPHQVAREFAHDEDSHADWHVVSRDISLHELAARHPDLAAEILNRQDEGEDSWRSILPYAFEGARKLVTTGRTRIHTLYHDRVPHLPEGRRTVILDDLVLEDGPLPFKPYPVKRMAPEDQALTCFGYTGTFDLLAISDVIDMLYSTVITNNNATGVQTFWAPPGAGTSLTALASGLNLIESMVEPKVLQLTKSAPEAYELIKALEGIQEVLSGVNSVARGNPDGALKGASGSALALLQSMTIQFASGLQEGYAQLAEDVGQAIIEILQEKASIPRWADLVGKQNRSYARTFSGQDLRTISRVVVDLGNPAARTFAGRKQIADEMMAAGQFKRPEQYLTFLATGRFEALVEHEQSQLLLVKKENEELKDGRPVLALITDNAYLHVREHQAVLDDPETRRNPELTRIVLDHIQEHVNLARQMPPELAALLGVQPLPFPTPIDQGQASQPAAGGGAPAQEMAGGPAPETGMPPGGAGEMPRMPVDPLSGEQAPAPGEPMVAA